MWVPYKMGIDKLPPVSKGSDALLEWFKSEHIDKWGYVPEWKVMYLTGILKGEYQYIEKYVIGTQIGGWKVEVQVGASSYGAGFSPVLTPDVMIRMGIFGGLGIRGIEREIPIEWIMYGLIDDSISYHDFPDQNLNFCKVLSDPYPHSSERDTRHFFHWYCRYYLGKRSDEDVSMIKIWNIRKKKYSKVCKMREMNHGMSRQNLIQYGYNPYIVAK